MRKPGLTLPDFANAWPKAAACALVALVVAGCAFLRLSFLPFRDTDTATLAECIENVWQTGIPHSRVKAVVLDYLEARPKPIITAPADRLCTRDYPAPALEPVNQFRRHTYFIIYLLAPFTAFFSGEDVAIFSNALGYLASLLVLWAFLRQEGLPPAERLLFCALVLSHPVWSQGFAHGQPYPDRLFLPLFLGCLACMVRQRPGWAFYVLGVLAAATVDRAAIIAGATICGYAVLYRWRDPQQRNRLLLFGVILGACGALILTTFITSSFAGSFVADMMRLYFLDRPGFLQDLGLLLLVNAVLLLMGLAQWRALLLAIVAMLPNVLCTVGAGTLTGWSQHYHMLNFPVLIWAAALGWSRLSAAAERPARTWRRALPVAALLAALALTCLMNTSPDRSAPPLALANASGNAVAVLAKWAQDYAHPLEQSAIKLSHRYRDQLLQAVPEGSRVSMVSDAIPTLYRNRDVFYFPQGMDDAEYLVLIPNGRTDPGQVPLGRLDSYLPAKERQRAEDCVMRRVAERFDVPGALKVGDFVVLRRKP